MTDSPKSDAHAERARLATRGFANGVRYATARPSYPDDAIAYLSKALDTTHATVIDVGAGTGIFTRQIAPRCGQIVAVEPSEGMRASFKRETPGIEIRDGRDTSLPFDDASVDVITVAQAFHWFDPVAALTEFARVLRPGGRLGLIWNERDETVPWVAAMSRAMFWDQRAPYDVGMDFAPVIARGPFEDVQFRHFEHHQRLNRELLDQRVLTTSYIAVMNAAEQAIILDDVRSVVEEFPDEFDLPYVTSTYCARLTGNTSV